MSCLGNDKIEQLPPNIDTDDSDSDTATTTHPSLILMPDTNDGLPSQDLDGHGLLSGDVDGHYLTVRAGGQMVLASERVWRM